MTMTIIQGNNGGLFLAMFSVVLHYNFELVILSVLNHGTAIQTGITCKKILCYIHDSACRWYIVMLNIFETLHAYEITESCLVYTNKFL